MGPHYVGLLVFGGVDPVSEIRCANAFEKGFSIEANETSWEKIGAAVKKGSSPESDGTITRACLQSAKVRHDGTDTNDPLFDKYQAIQAHNERATTALDYLGYKDHLLHVKFNEDVHRRKKPVTVKNSKERQEAIAQAKTHSQLFHATGGQHLTADDIFKGAEVNNKMRKIAEMEKDKAARIEFEKRRVAASA